MKNVNIPKYDTKQFFEDHMLTTIELEMSKNADLTREKAGKIVKNKNKTLLYKLIYNKIIPNINLMLTSTKFERMKNNHLSHLQAQNIAIRKNNLLIAKLQDLAYLFPNKQMIIFEKVSTNQERIIFSRNISFEKNEVLLLLALIKDKSEITITDLSKIATAFSCRLGQRKNQASHIIRKTLKALNKGNKVYFKIQEKNTQVQKSTAIHRIHKEFRKLVAQNIITDEQRKILIIIVDNILKQENSSEMAEQLSQSLLEKYHVGNLVHYVKNIQQSS